MVSHITSFSICHLGTDIVNGFEYRPERKGYWVGEQSGLGHDLKKLRLGSVV